MCKFNGPDRNCFGEMTVCDLSLKLHALTRFSLQKVIWGHLLHCKAATTGQCNRWGIGRCLTAMCLLERVMLRSIAMNWTPGHYLEMLWSLWFMAIATADLVLSAGNRRTPRDAPKKTRGRRMCLSALAIFFCS